MFTSCGLSYWSFLALSEVLDFTVPLQYVCICAWLSSLCKPEDQDTTCCYSFNSACGKCYNPDYHGALALHTHTHIIKTQRPQKQHPPCSRFPTTHTHTHIKNILTLLFDSSLWFGVRRCYRTRKGDDWIIKRERQGLGWKHNWITNRKSLTAGERDWINCMKCLAVRETPGADLCLPKAAGVLIEIL